jgi:hypothetical protein
MRASRGRAPVRTCAARDGPPLLTAPWRCHVALPSLPPRAPATWQLMVLEAIFGEESFIREGGVEPPAFALAVAGEAAGGGEVTVRLRVSMLAEYPSHLPPGVEIVDGVGVEDAGFVSDSLRALFYAQREEGLAADEPPEGVVHRWAEWLRDEWMAAQGASA